MYPDKYAPTAKLNAKAQIAVIAVAFVRLDAI